MTCSARSLGAASSSARAARSSGPPGASAPRGRVPLIGRVSTPPRPSARRKRSGELPARYDQPPDASAAASQAACGAGAERRSAAASHTGSPGPIAAESRRARFTW